MRNTVRCDVILCNTVRCEVILCNTVRCEVILCNTVRYDIGVVGIQLGLHLFQAHGFDLGGAPKSILEFNKWKASHNLGK